MADKIHFGPGCSAIKVDPFEPICGYPEPQKSSASTFEVPIPAFVPPVPPSECVCFDFTSEEVAVTPVRCDQPTKCRVEITPVGDCCDGLYKVTPHIEVPCIPFDIAPAVVTTTVKEGTTPKASFRLEKDCFGCQLKPFLDIEFPIPKIVVPTPCFRVEGDGGVYPTQASVKGKKTRTVSAMDTSPQQFAIRAKYKNASGDDDYTTPAYFAITEDTSSECDRFIIGSATIDLTGIGGGGGGANGGSVNMMTADKTMEIDGTLSDGDAVWFGGGYGDMTRDETDADLTSVFCRGAYMRGTSDSVAPDVPYGSAAEERPVRHAADIAQPQYVRAGTPPEGGAKTITRWESDRAVKTQQEGGGYIWSNSRTGILDIVWPTGAQWHAEGLALTLTEFMIHPSGVISAAAEVKDAILVSPPPAVSIVNGSKYKASGLSIYNESPVRSGMSHGLSVKDGAGLRIHGIDARTTGWTSAASWTHYGDDDQGALEVNWGRGLHIASGCTGTSAAGVNDKLEIHATPGDFVFYGSDKTKVADAQLAIDDRNRNTGGAYHRWDSTGLWTRNNAEKKELIIRFMVDYDVDKWGQVTPRFGYARFLANGNVLSYLYFPDDDGGSSPPDPASLDHGRSTRTAVDACGT